MHIYSMPQPQKLASAEIPTFDRFRNFHVICSLSESEDLFGFGDTAHGWARPEDGDSCSGMLFL